MKKFSGKSNIGAMFWEVFKSATFVEAAATGTGLFDGIIVSRMLGADSMASQGIVQPYFTIALVFSGLLAAGLSALCSAELARGNVKESQKIVSASLVTGAIVSVILMIFLFFFPDTVAYLLGARGNASGLLPEASEYVKGLSYGVIPQIILFILTPVLDMDGNGKLVIRSSVILLFINAILDISFVRMGAGMFGIGLSTSIGNFISLGILLTHFLKKDRMFSLSFKEIGWNHLGKICILGSGKAVINGAFSLALVAINSLMVSAGGTIGMSALSVRANALGFLCIPTTGMAEAVAMLSGIAFGEKNKKECREIGKLAHKYVLIYGFAVTVLMILFSSQLAKFYDPTNGELATLSKFVMYTLGINVTLDALIYCRSTYMRSIRQIFKTQLIIVVNYLAISVLTAVVGAKLFGAYGVIASFAAGNIIMCIIMYIFQQIKARKIIPNVEDHLSLPEEFNIAPEDKIELSISEKQQAVTLAEQIQQFCKRHNMDDAKGYKAALCLEEITTNILTHGYKKTKKVLPVDVHVTISGEDIILFVRDNCQRFDLTERIKLMQENPSKEKNIGIRMIQKTAKDIRYVNIIGTNTLLITV